MPLHLYSSTPCIIISNLFHNVSKLHIETGPDAHFDPEMSATPLRLYSSTPLDLYARRTSSHLATTILRALQPQDGKI